MTELELSIKASFGIMDASEIELISKMFRYEQLDKGAFLLKQHRYCDKMSFVQSGFLRIYGVAGDREITQWISPKGYFMTELASFFYNQPSRWNIQALTEVELWSIGKQDYEQLHKLMPKWADIEKQYIIHCFTTLEGRIFGHLSMSAEERYHYFFEQQPELFNQVPLQYIASMLGMTPETFSRIRKKQLMSQTS